MLIKYICVFLIGLFFAKIGNAADSDGKEFVFTFANDIALSLSPAASTSLIVIPSYNDATCSFTYTQNSDYKTVTFQKRLHMANQTSEVLVQFVYNGNSFGQYGTKDYRIFVSCTEEVKLIGKVGDPVSGWGDQFLVPSLKNAGTFYNFAMPMSDTFFKGTIGILPVSKQGPITINIFGYVNEKFVLDETDTYETTLGKDQHYIAIYFDKSNGDPLISNTNASITIMSSSPVMLSFESPHSTTSDNGNDGSCGAHCYNDFVQFMPIPSQPIKCGSALKIPDQRMITDDYTTRLHVSAPNSVTNCDSSITVYADVNDINGTKQNVDNMGFTQISLMNTEFSGFSTYDSQLSTNRFGSIFGNDGLDTYGHFMHYVPSTEEWLTGKTQFYTLAKDCVLEIYADNSDSNAVNAIKLDGYPLSALKYYSKNIPFFGSRYTQYVSNMQGYGLHKLESDSNSYVAYVLCQSVNAFFNANGYLVGFNRRKSN